MVDHDGNIFYQATPHLKLPFVTTDKYELVDLPDLKSVMHKLKLNDMKVKVLEKQVAESYCAEHLERFFKEKKMDAPNIMLIQKIICTYQDWLNLIFSSESEWYTRNQTLNCNTVLTNIEKDAEKIKMFTEYYYSVNP